jgi:uncharacterized protein YgbK (DUF1537 family)
MRSSNLVDILQSQTDRRVGLIPIHIVEQGVSVLEEQIAVMKQSGFTYVIFDVRDQQSLKTIAQAVHAEPIICGSSALAEELALLEKPNALQKGVANKLPALGRSAVLCAAGSLMPQTAAQIAYAKKQGLTALELNSLLLFDPIEKHTLCKQLVEQASRLLKDGQDVLIHASNSPLKVAGTKVKGVELGYDNTEVSIIVSNALSDVIQSVVNETGQQRLLIAGGETSAAVCDKLGIGGLSIWQEIEPGLPSCLTLQTPQRFLVLKSGSFGSEPFFIEAIEHLKQT